MERSVYSICCGKLKEARAKVTRINKYNNTTFKIPNTEEEAILLLETEEVANSIVVFTEEAQLPLIEELLRLERKILEYSKITPGYECTELMELREQIISERNKMCNLTRNMLSELKSYLAEKAE